jgi:uncharacterized protein YjbI with pentapeptide repeats
MNAKRQEETGMANQEHLDILKQGVEVWNKWREETQNTEEEVAHIVSIISNSEYARPEKFRLLSKALVKEADLSEVDLSGKDFSEINFTSANLSKSNLRNTTFNRARLMYANLYKSDLEEASFSLAELGKSNLSNANLRGASFTTATLIGSDLSRANLQEASFLDAHLDKADLRGANLRWADLSGAIFHDANLSGANLREANLELASFVGTNLKGANLTGCLIHGASVWNVNLENATQNDLVITYEDEPRITVDKLEVAQFIYLLLNNTKIRAIIYTITSKVVLILGRFTPERKRVLDALRDELRKKDLLPIVFDFDAPDNRNVTETVTTLARMSRFIIADITDPKSIPHELASIVPGLPSVPVQPLLHARSKAYGMFKDFKEYPWVLEAYRYTTVNRLLASLKEHIIEPAERKAKELAKR